MSGHTMVERQVDDKTVESIPHKPFETIMPSAEIATKAGLAPEQLAKTVNALAADRELRSAFDELVNLTIAHGRDLSASELLEPMRTEEMHKAGVSVTRTTKA